MTFSRKWLLLVFGLSLFSCAVSVKHHANRFDSPEALGDPVSYKVDAAAVGGNEAVFTPDFATTPPDLQNPSLLRDLGPRFSAGVGLAERLDLEIRTPTSLHAKYQLLGDNSVDTGPGNFAVAITTTVGLISTFKSEDISSTEERRVTLKGVTLDAALILGYRFSDLILAYGGGFGTRSSYSSEYEIFGATSSQSELDGTMTSFGGNLGIEVGTSTFQFRVEGAFQDTTAGSSKRDGIFGGVNATMAF